MSFNINGVEYYTQQEVADAAGVKRETIWRWRRDHKIPDGTKFHRTRLFTTDEAEEIKRYATQPTTITQIPLFRRRSG